jgi:hypothetical protein
MKNFNNERGRRSRGSSSVSSQWFKEQISDQTFLNKEFETLASEFIVDMAENIKAQKSGYFTLEDKIA